MIKYIELTAPQTSVFRQAKILSIECEEGDYIKQGDTLFMVLSGKQEVPLPSTSNGTISEVIAVSGENITISTALLLLETEVADSESSTPAPIKKEAKVDQRRSKKKTKSKTKKSKKKASKKTATKEHKQQSLDLLLDREVSEPIEQTNALSDTQQEDSDSMSSDAKIEIHVPDIGADSAKVIEILVSPGDQIEQEQALITLESDKASMDVPSTAAGLIISIDVSVDDEIGEGTLIATIETNTQATPDNESVVPQPSDTKENSEKSPEKACEENTEDGAEETKSAQAETSLSEASTTQNIMVPDIGGDSAKVIELLVNVGDSVKAEDSLLTLESDKASMDVPCPADGIIESIKVNIDDEVSEGTLIATIASKTSPQVKAESGAKDNSAGQQTKQSVEKTSQPKAVPQSATSSSVNTGKSHASPSVRRFARELGVDLSKVEGSGRKGRVLEADVKGFVKDAMNSSQAPSQANAGGAIPAIPAQDFSKYGEVDFQPLNKIKRLTATNLHRSWLNVPHVTHNDEANISELESFRKKINQDFKTSGSDIKISPLAFIVKAIVRGLKAYPQFNSSLEAGGEQIIYKKYFNVGIAVDTPNGLVVPVIKQADSKSISQIASEMNELAEKARNGKLSIADMSGACITISSLGGIGGTSFTPIVNAPEVAILGVSRSKMAPVWNGQEFEPSMMLPLSLSYDHRVIDGAEAARFTRHIAEVLEDVRLLSI